MKILLLSTLLSLTAPALAGAVEFCPARTEPSACQSSGGFDLALFARRPSATDCYLECKPASGGNSGNSYTKCFNACMRRR